MPFAVAASIHSRDLPWHIRACGVGSRVGVRAGRRNVPGQVLRSNHGTIARSVFEHPLQLAHVSRPPMRNEANHRVGSHHASL